MWLAEEEKRYTTMRIAIALSDKLWLAEEEKRYTTWYLNMVLRQSCGLLKKRRDIQRQSSRNIPA